MEFAILILVLLFATIVVLGVYASVKAIGAAKSGVDRTILQARRTFEDTSLRARSLGGLGVAGELAQLRLRLRTSMRATQETLQAGSAEDASLSESIALFQRLGVHGRELDGELKQLERDPDRARITERMRELRERTERIARSADSLRWAARDRARKFGEDDLSSLSEQIDVESGALRHWSAAERPAVGEQPPGRRERTDRPGAVDREQLAADTGWPGPEQGVVWPEPASSDATTAEGQAVGWPDPARPGERRVPEEQPVDRKDRRPRGPYPWRKPSGPTGPGTTD
jgi:hypothetical protein